MNFSKNKTGTRATRMRIPKPLNKKGRDNSIAPEETSAAIIFVFLPALNLIRWLLEKNVVKYTIKS